MNLYRGLNQQATIIATAPLIGLLGTVDQIMAGCYFGFVGDKWSIMMAHVACYSDALYLSAYGLALAIVTTWFRNYLTHRADTLLAEVNAHGGTPGTRPKLRFP